MFKFLSLRSPTPQANGSNYYPSLLISPSVGNAVKDNILLKYPCTISTSISPVNNVTDTGQVFGVYHWPQTTPPAANSDLLTFPTPLHHPATGGFLNQLGQTTNDSKLNGLLVGSATFTTQKENLLFQFRYMSTVMGSMKVVVYTTLSNGDIYALAYLYNSSQVSLIKIPDYSYASTDYNINWYIDLKSNMKSPS